MGLELTKLTYTRLKDNLIRRRGMYVYVCLYARVFGCVRVRVCFQVLSPCVCVCVYTHVLFCVASSRKFWSSKARACLTM